MMSNRMEYKKQMMMMVLYPHKNHQRVLTVFTVANKSQPCESATGSSSVTPTPHTPMFYKKISCPILFYSNIFIKFSPTFYLASGRLYTNVQSSEFCLHIWSLASQATSSKAKLTKRNKNFNSHKFHFLWPVTPKPA